MFKCSAAGKCEKHADLDSQCDRNSQDYYSSISVQYTSYRSSKAEADSAFSCAVFTLFKLNPGAFFFFQAVENTAFALGYEPKRQI